MNSDLTYTEDIHAKTTPISDSKNQFRLQRDLFRGQFSEARDQQKQFDWLKLTVFVRFCL